jgi:hypothetical protein
MHVSAGELVPKPTGEPTPNPVLDPQPSCRREPLRSCREPFRHDPRGALHVAVAEPCCDLARSRGATAIADIRSSRLLLVSRPGSHEPHNEHHSGCVRVATVMWNLRARRSTLVVGKGGVGESG